MDEMTRQWLTTLVFAVTVVAAMIAETLWLIKRGPVAPARAVAYVLLTDLLSMIVSFAAVIVFMLMLLMLVFGPSGLGTTGYEALMWVVIILGILFPPIVFVLIKRVFLHFFSVFSGRAAWLYAAAVSLLLLVVTPTPAAIVHYLLEYTR
jgi:hypothetical protein